MSYDRTQGIAFLIIAVMLMYLFVFVYIEWRRYQRRREEREDEDRKIEAEYRDQEIARAREAEMRQREIEERRLYHERQGVEAQFEAIRRAEKAEHDSFIANSSGAGSGGYVMIDVPEADRSLFHDLAKGFEDYSRLKGYMISFSIDNSWEGRTAYKFTVHGRGVGVGSEQIRSDFKEYVDKVCSDDDHEFEEMPVITSPAEHELMITMLKNRVVFFKANYKAYKNVVTMLERLTANPSHLFPALPQPPVVIHNGVNMSSRNYNANNSQRLIQGDGNTFNDSSINIGRSLSEKNERVAALDKVIEKLKATEDPALARAEVNLAKVRDELVDEKDPSEASIVRWLETAKNVMAGVVLGHELAEAVTHLWHLFGI